MKRNQIFFTLAIAVALSALTLGRSLDAQEPAAPAATTAPTAAPATPPAAAPSAEDKDKALLGVAAYLNNTDPAGTTLQGVTGVPGPGHNAFMMIAAALVLFMTLPGLALFYGGLVRAKNVLSVLAQCLGIAGLVTILWWAAGYSLVFADVGGAGGDSSTFLGSLKHMTLKDVTSAPDTNYAYWVSGNVFSMYQLMFAIITPALIVGAIAERMKFLAVMIFITLWMFAVYFPLAHMVWGIDGFMNGVWNAKATIKAIDFAGGTVVHMSSGWSALVLCLILGKRLGFGKDKMAPHSMVLCMVGTGMLWVGWYGFNAGSALAADGVAANAFTTTTLCTAVASFVWAMIEAIHRGKPSILGFCSGAVAGLVVITPACGFVDSTAAVIMGALAALVPYIAVVIVKPMIGYDDALDTFGVHAVGGTLGAFLTGVFAKAEINANLKTNLADIVGKTLWLEQLKAIVVTLLLSVVATTVIAFIVKAAIGLRPIPEVETGGLDINEHGEEGYAV